jgi:hypothetical protein
VPQPQPAVHIRFSRIKETSSKGAFCVPVLWLVFLSVPSLLPSRLVDGEQVDIDICAGPW